MHDLDDAEAYRDWSDEDEPEAACSQSAEVRERGTAGSSRGGAGGHSGGEAEEEEASVSGEEEEEEECSCSGHEPQPPWPERFPDLHRRMAEAIQELGGCVVPKLNWSCPSDATWVNPSTTLACSNAGQVVLMLKSSDRITHDLELLGQDSGGRPLAGSAEEAADSSSGGATAPVLVLRKW